jgi:hypothetical protein
MVIARVRIGAVSKQQGVGIDPDLGREFELCRCARTFVQTDA